MMIQGNDSNCRFCVFLLSWNPGWTVAHDHYVLLSGFLIKSKSQAPLIWLEISPVIFGCRESQRCANPLGDPSRRKIMVREALANRSLCSLHCLDTGLVMFHWGNVEWTYLSFSQWLVDSKTGFKLARICNMVYQSPASLFLPKGHCWQHRVKIWTTCRRMSPPKRLLSLLQNVHNQWEAMCLVAFGSNWLHAPSLQAAFPTHSLQ